METYCGQTRVELTTLGWLYVAKRSIKQRLATDDKVKQSKLEREAALAIRSASEMLRAQTPKGLSSKQQGTGKVRA